MKFTTPVATTQLELAFVSRLIFVEVIVAIAN